MYVSLSVLFSDHPISEGPKAPQSPLTRPLLKGTGMSQNLPEELDDVVFCQNIALTTPVKGMRNQGGVVGGTTPDFVKSVNPISTGEGRDRLCPP